MPAIRKIQLANLKANLYRQLLSSLRMYHAGHNLDIQLHEQLDFARVLYNRGLYQHSLRMLEKVKATARQAEMRHIVLLALEFEKLIEGQYITRSIRGRAASSPTRPPTRWLTWAGSTSSPTWPCACTGATSKSGTPATRPITRR